LVASLLFFPDLVFLGWGLSFLRPVILFSGLFPFPELRSFRDSSVRFACRPPIFPPSKVMFSFPLHAFPCLGPPRRPFRVQGPGRSAFNLMGLAVFSFSSDLFSLISLNFRPSPHLKPTALFFRIKCFLHFGCGGVLFSRLFFFLFNRPAAFLAFPFRWLPAFFGVVLRSRAHVIGFSAVDVCDIDLARFEFHFSARETLRCLNLCFFWWGQFTSPDLPRSSSRRLPGFVYHPPPRLLLSSPFFFLALLIDVYFFFPGPETPVSSYAFFFQFGFSEAPACHQPALPVFPRSPSSLFLPPAPLSNPQAPSFFPAKIDFSGSPLTVLVPLRLC